MHSLNHSTLAAVTAADHRRRIQRVPQRGGRRHPPPVRGRMAAMTARLAIRLDGETARRAIV